MTHTPLPPMSYLDLGTPDALLIAANLVRKKAKELTAVFANG